MYPAKVYLEIEWPYKKLTKPNKISRENRINSWCELFGFANVGSSYHVMQELLFVRPSSAGNKKAEGKIMLNSVMLSILYMNMDIGELSTLPSDIFVNEESRFQRVLLLMHGIDRSSTTVCQ